jgi:diguanylate cyclase (GGDEF)-like protein
MNDIHILFVDDEPDILRAIDRLLRKESYILHFAGSGSEALAIMAKTPMHIVVTDIKMPGMDGLSLLKQIQALYPDTVRMALSGYLQIGQLLPCINTGEIFRYVTKPTKPEDLKTSLQDATDYLKIQNDHIAHVHELHEKNEKQEQALQQHQEVEKQLRRLAIKDDVTELYNRRFLSYSMEQLFERCKRYGNDLSCIIIELDNFKQLNDLHGFPFGDAVLKEFSNRLIKLLSGTDIGFRYGGARFIVLLPNTMLEIALVLGKTILKSCQSTPFIHEGRSETITASIGAASLRQQNPKTPDSLMQIADRILAGYKLSLTQKHR